MLSGTVPIHLKLHFVKINPLEQEAQRSMRKIARNLARHDVDDHFGSLVSSVDVGWIMITIVHEDHDTIEATDNRHSATDRSRVLMVVEPSGRSHGREGLRDSLQASIAVDATGDYVLCHEGRQCEEVAS